ncbi:MAG TPA: dihydrodipicolinate synthase family protein [Candidatus Sulfopaludibacter sp.]|jgi:dihydrodipicolinate synthase/N-acetylneuraminate lyase|nr:dihydrodipicolinate synthase family protein [Candidatus Sulfopaludibacter sp.]
MSDVQGVYAAAITPRGKHGDIDFGACFELIDFLCKGGVSGIALCTASGEFAALDDQERSRLVYLAVKRSRVPVLVGVGSATLEASVGLAREARDAGAAGLLLPPPHFFAYDQDDLREFYLQFAEQLGEGTSTYLSQLPASGCNLEPATAMELLSTGRFAGIELGLRGIVRTADWRILSVDDAHFVAARCAGAHAAISPAACAVPELMSQLDRALAANNQPRAQELDGRLQELLAWVHQFPQPAILKIATGLRGLKTGPLAVPLSPEKLARLEQFRAWFRQWMPDTKKLTS